MSQWLLTCNYCGLTTEVEAECNKCGNFYCKNCYVVKDKEIICLKCKDDV